MTLPRMTTMRWMIVVGFIAAWLAFVARAERLRGLGVSHMREFTTQRRTLFPAEEYRSESGLRRRHLAAWHLKRAKECNLEADFVEAFQLALILSGVVLAVGVVVRDARRGRVESTRQ